MPKIIVKVIVENVVTCFFWGHNVQQDNVQRTRSLSNVIAEALLFGIM